ncbi:hypothetical protein PAXRUDRAFT_777688 [Paxillus rubicundulus Ve08.2h10]|uniref:Uncharacterized protein n=1 Tax=Paxillus rubicundulus Ve08.2h10 TaxID=930991 RepID=A0A0D0D1M6_9AGAM|nr:hypothetical protein PAXRUDRAFT_777688 [Paxillus rubicundulus Ve08.2h10]
MSSSSPCMVTNCLVSSQHKKRGRAKNKGGHLVSDGLPRLLSVSLANPHQVVDHQKVAEEEAMVKEA